MAYNHARRVHIYICSLYLVIYGYDLHASMWADVMICLLCLFETLAGIDLNSWFL